MNNGSWSGNASSQGGTPTIPFLFIGTPQGPTIQEVMPPGANLPGSQFNPHDLNMQPPGDQVRAQGGGPLFGDQVVERLAALNRGPPPTVDLPPLVSSPPTSNVSTNVVINTYTQIRAQAQASGFSAVDLADDLDGWVPPYSYTAPTIDNFTLPAIFTHRMFSTGYLRPLYVNGPANAPVAPEYYAQITGEPLVPTIEQGNSFVQGTTDAFHRLNQLRALDYDYSALRPVAFLPGVT